MKRRGDAVRYTAEEIDEMRARGESRTDWAAVKAMTEDELEASIAADPDDVHEPIDWSRAAKGIPPRKRDISHKDRRGRARRVPASRPRLSEPNQRRAARLHGESQARIALAGDLTVHPHLGLVEQMPSHDVNRFPCEAVFGPCGTLLPLARSFGAADECHAIKPFGKPNAGIPRVRFD